MARIIPTSLVAAISGRTCQNDSTHFLTNKQTGRVYAAKLCNPCDGSDPSAKQQTVRDAFAQMQAVASAWRVANAPTEAQPKGTAEYQAMMRQYKAQHKYGSWYAFVRAKIKDGVLPSFLDGTVADAPSSGSGTTTNPPSGGGGVNVEG